VDVAEGLLCHLDLGVFFGGVVVVVVVVGSAVVVQFG
jgi:hypothetical protein